MICFCRLCERLNCVFLRTKNYVLNGVNFKYIYIFLCSLIRYSAGVITKIEREVECEIEFESLVDITQAMTDVLHQLTIG